MKIAICFGLVVSAAALSGEFFAAQAQQPPPQSPNMTFFVTGAGPGRALTSAASKALIGIVRNWRSAQAQAPRPGVPI